MAKILIEGKKDKVTCHRCGSYLHFFDSDIKLAKLPHGSFDYDIGHTMYALRAELTSQ